METHDNLLITILINNYNYGQFLKEAIDSALNQTYPYCEVIVVDDGSTDNSREVIASYKDKDKIVPIFKDNGGQASAFNIGFAASQGKVIFLLDSDDIFMPTKVAEVVNIFNTNPDIAWCFHPQKLMDNCLEKVIEYHHNCSSSGVYDLRQPIRRGKLNNYLPDFGIPATSGLCFCRSLLAKILPMPETETIYLSDSYIKYLAIANSKGFALAKPLSIQRIHNSNAYTMCSNQNEKTAKISIITAYWIRVKSPSISCFADNTFAMGLGLYRQVTNKKVVDKKVINLYFSQISLIEKIKIYLKSFYYRFKFK